MAATSSIRQSCTLSLLALLMTAARSAPTFSNAYCSNQNTGSAAGVQQQSIYMSMGTCHNQCAGSFAFAILQADSCWCSNYIPANQVSTSSCSSSCPGYPDDLCGNKGEGLYGYIALSNSPSGTAGASSGGSSTTSSSSAGRTSSSIVTSSDSPSSTSPEDSSTQTTDAPSTTKAQPVTSVITVTQNGGQVIQTVTSSPTSGSPALGETKKSSGVSTGAIIGSVVAATIGVAIIGALFFLLRRRRRQEESEKFGGLRDEDGSRSSNLNRNASTNSKAGLLGRGYAPTVTTGNSTHGMDMSSDAYSPTTPVSERRQSRPGIVFDQRMNPVMVMENGSHTSLRSLRTIDDSHDYGRPLRVLNPDEGRPSIS